MSQNKETIWKEVTLGFGPVTSYVSPFVASCRRLSHNGWPCQRPFRYNRSSLLVKMEVNFSSTYNNECKCFQSACVCVWQPNPRALWFVYLFIYFFCIKCLEQPCSAVLTFSSTELSGRGNWVSCQLLQSAISLLFLVVNTWLFSKALLGILLFQLDHKDPHLPLPTFPSRNRLAQMTGSRQKFNFNVWCLIES